MCGHVGWYNRTQITWLLSRASRNHICTLFVFIAYCTVMRPSPNVHVMTLLRRGRPVPPVCGCTGLFRFCMCTNPTIPELATACRSPRDNLMANRRQVLFVCLPPLNHVQTTVLQVEEPSRIHRSYIQRVADSIQTPQTFICDVFDSNSTLVKTNRNMYNLEYFAIISKRTEFRMTPVSGEGNPQCD